MRSSALLRDEMSSTTEMSYRHTPARSRLLAIVQLAVHDALNAIEPRYAAYAFQGQAHQVRVRDLQAAAEELGRGALHRAAERARIGDPVAHEGLGAMRRAGRVRPHGEGAIGRAGEERPARDHVPRRSRPVRPAVGYRFEYGGRSLVVSGDTAKSANLEAQAKGVDLLVHEALAPQLVKRLHDAAEAAGRANVAKITNDILDYHATPVEAAESAQATGAKHLLFYHVIPPLPLPGLDRVFLEGVSDAFDGGVTLGRDGTLISLPKGSQAVEVSKR